MSAALQQVQPTRTPVPWHCQMAAERLIEQATASDHEVIALARQWTLKIRARMARKRGRHSPARPGDLIQLKEQWRYRLAGVARLGFVTDWLRKRSGEAKGITISDIRLISCKLGLSSWPIDHREYGTGIVLITCRIAPNANDMKSDVLCVLTTHALGRRYERGIPSNDDAVLQDLQRLAYSIMTTPDHHTIDVPSGRWAGEPLRVRDMNALAIRTFLFKE
jgi:hypothetical protein